jgi:hypothetical protein
MLSFSLSNPGSIPAVGNVFSFENGNGSMKLGVSGEIVSGDLIRCQSISEANIGTDGARGRERSEREIH